MTSQYIPLPDTPGSTPLPLGPRAMREAERNQPLAELRHLQAQQEAQQLSVSEIIHQVATEIKQTLNSA